MIKLKIKKRSKIYSIFILLLIFINFNIIFSEILAFRTENISGFSTQDKVYPNEIVRYKFYNNIVFDISTDTFIDLNIQYENNIENRQIFFQINNSIPISLNISSKVSMQNFGMPQSPQGPRRGDSQYRYGYNCIFQIKTNATLEYLVVSSIKRASYGLSPNLDYSLAFYESSQDSWELIDTTEELNESSSEYSLTGSVSNLQADTEYFITFYEITDIFDDWILVIVLILGAIGIASLAILISKSDYFQYLKTRTVPIEKGAHRLSLEEVLENENRNRIIDLILKEPGIHFNELLRKTELAAGNLVWHLDILETYKVVGKKRIGNFIAYFPYYQKNPISNLDLQLSKSKLTLEILEMIEKEPGLWNSIITKHFKVDHKTIQYHINKLKDLGLINFKSEGRKKKIFPNLDSDYFNKKET
jgi:DNA-binding transcriptional ArsR family regulator